MKVKKSDQKVLKTEHWQNFNVTAAELGRLFARSPAAVYAWVKYKNLIRNADGTFNLRNSIRWLENYYRECATIKITLDALTQNQLAELLGKPRQRIHDWVRAGLPGGGDGMYDLSVVLRWLPRYYEKYYREKYKRKSQSQPIVKKPRQMKKP